VIAAIVGVCSFAAVLLLLERRPATPAARLAPYVGAPARRRKRRVGGATPTRLVAAAVGCAAVGAGLAAAAGLPFVVGLLCGGALPHLVLRVRATGRARAFDGQLPDLLDMLAASLRVGHGFEQSLRSAADGAPPPAGVELQRALGEIRLGAPAADALAAVGRRLSSEDLVYVSVAVGIQQEVGGSLAELLGVVTEAVRERQQFRRRVRAITGMQRMSAGVLVVLPLLAAAALSALSPGYMRPLWHTSTGRMLVAIALAMMLAGTLVLRRIVAVRS
jgi:tight adherence protein B